MRNRTVFTMSVCALLVTATLGAQQAADKAYLGTWKLNPAKSKFEPGPGPTELTRVHEDAGGGQIKVTTKSMAPNGTPGATTVYTYRPDGKDVPITGGNPNGPVMIAINRVDDYTVTYQQKLADGKVVSSGRRVLAQDGKTMTITSTGTNASGDKTSSTQFFDKP